MNIIISNLSCEDLEKKVKEDPQKSVKFANNNFNCKQKTTFNKYPVILAILVTPSL